MSIGYNPSIPNPPNDPADDVFVMQTNAAAIAQYVAVDHVAFNTAVSGQHKQVTFNNVLSMDPDQTAPVSTLYTKDVNGSPQLFFQNGDDPTDVEQISSGGGSGLFVLYNPNVTVTVANITNLTGQGYYAIVGGITYFTINVGYASSTGNSAFSFQLPSAPAVTGGSYVVGGQSSVGRVTTPGGGGSLISQGVQTYTVVTASTGAQPGTFNVIIHGFYI